MKDFYISYEEIIDNVEYSREKIVSGTTEKETIKEIERLAEGEVIIERVYEITGLDLQGRYDRPYLYKSLKKGDMVTHPILGEGRVTKSMDLNSFWDTEVEVRFKDNTTREVIRGDLRLGWKFKK